MKVFITRNLGDDSILYSLENQVQIEGQSLLKFELIPFSDIPESDWIFFYSSQGVRFFSEGLNRIYKTLDSNVKIGVLGVGTKKTFQRTFDRVPDFVGSGNKDVSVSFYEKINGHILFVKAKDSLSSVERSLEDNRCSSLVVYRNEIDQDVIVPVADIAVITSPMNGIAFLNTKEAAKFQLVIAIGGTTFAKLQELDCPNLVQADSPSEEGIFKTIKERLR